MFGELWNDAGQQRSADVIAAERESSSIQNRDTLQLNDFFDPVRMCDREQPDFPAHEAIIRFAGDAALVEHWRLIGHHRSLGISDRKTSYDTSRWRQRRCDDCKTSPLLGEQAPDLADRRP